MNTLGFFPKGKFVEISITGHKCPLNCPMCGGKWLRGMKSVKSPEELVLLAKHLMKQGVKGILVSGGLDKRGKLPIRPFEWALREMKKMGLFISVHTGVVGREEATILSRADVDLADYELILDMNAIHKSKGLHLRPEDFIRGMELLLENGIEVVPHVTVGLPGSSNGWIKLASDIISELEIRRSVVLAFIPTPGTLLEREDSPKIEDIVESVGIMKKSSRVSLGCMRPPWLKEKLDIKLLGIVDRIANPHPHLNIKKVNACCSIPDRLIEEFMM